MSEFIQKNIEKLYVQYYNGGGRTFLLGSGEDARGAETSRTRSQLTAPSIPPRDVYMGKRERD
ncbi:hypothetical protein PcaKH16_20260 [Parageobacillus caldoxylosilyticus]|nr:hypothetical protein PcaKH16_20260 [Parageobacillus caldoxylosilyticus]